MTIGLRPNHTPAQAPCETTSSADAAVCSEDSTCTACDACCVDYFPDQATCDACVEESCSDANTCTNDPTCNACGACCVDYFPDQATCDACVEEQC